jgi:4-diphosphocytidyl-2-C-methyl-D-erythritol kinase
MKTRIFAPAKINLCLHVTGQRPDGYHLLESLVAFADVGDWVTLEPASAPSLTVTGPRAAGVPEDGTNLCLRAAGGVGVAITLEKHLPAAAGIGGGSADAAAVLRGLAELGLSADVDPAKLGADVPVCMLSSAAVMGGVGETVQPVALPPLNAVLVNPGIAVPTAMVFAELITKQNPAMQPVPDAADAGTLTHWLGTQRNDLEPPARAGTPEIDAVLAALDDAILARMSGSGATCFGIYADAPTASAAAARIRQANAGWWVKATTLR